MTVSTDSKQLYNVTIRRTYTAKHRAQWSDVPEYSDSTHPEWADQAEDIVDRWDDIHRNAQPYWLAKYRDEVLLIEPLNADERRADAARRYGTERCCDLAIVKPCVCRVSFSCPVHGVKCNGTHD